MKINTPKSSRADVVNQIGGLTRGVRKKIKRKMAEENQYAGGGNPVQWKGEGMSFVGEMGVGGEIMVQVKKLCCFGVLS